MIANQAPPKDATIVFGRDDYNEWSLPCAWESWYWGDLDYAPRCYYEEAFIDAEDEELDPNDWDVWRYATRKDMKALWKQEDARKLHTETTRLFRNPLDTKEN
mgnify:FL=1